MQNPPNDMADEKFVSSTPKNIWESQLSADGFCLTETGIRRLDRSTFHKLTLVTDWGLVERTFAYWGEREEYLADVKTGSLYNLDGTSPSGSPLWVRVPAASRKIPAVA